MKHWFCLAWKFLILINSTINVYVTLVAEETASICYFSPPEEIYSRLDMTVWHFVDPDLGLEKQDPTE